MNNMNNLNLNLNDYLKELGACEAARDWAASYSTLQEAWDNCENASWMLWLINQQRHGESWSDDRKPLLACALDCAEAVKHLQAEKQKIQIGEAVKVLRQWIAGKASADAAVEARENLYAAAAAAYATSATAAATHAAYAVAAAADTAHVYDLVAHRQSYDTVSRALTYADTAADAQCVAKIIRKHFPNAPQVDAEYDDE